MLQDPVKGKVPATEMMLMSGWYSGAPPWFRILPSWKCSDIVPVAIEKQVETDERNHGKHLGIGTKEHDSKKRLGESELQSPGRSRGTCSERLIRVQELSNVGPCHAIQPASSETRETNLAQILSP
jgi:hypothetical protein